MTSPRSYFVYGTLRPGGRYWSNVSDYIEHYEPALLEGFAIYHLPEGYPAMIADEDASVFGDVLYVRSRCNDLVLDILDEIEGCNQPGRANLYDRLKVEVKRLGARMQPVVADTYVYASARHAYLRSAGTRVIHGDWREFVATREDLEP
jgi:gamma-glutamylcyclotransferase (GGCT)/AIG2-like uncharacterized protein YtfP